MYGFDIVAINYSQNSSANIICLGDGALIVGDTNREATDALDSQELTINLIDISEFVKGAGGPNCLIMPVERESTFYSNESKPTKTSDIIISSS